MSMIMERTEHSLEADDHGLIGCAICNARVHVMQKHLSTDHPEFSLADYKAGYPDAPILSPRALAAHEEAKRKAAAASGVTGTVTSVNDFQVEKVAFHTAFGFGNIKAAMGHSGNAIAIHKLTAPDALSPFVPERDKNYIFPIDLAKIVMLGLELGEPIYLHGHAGTGKSSIAKQVCAVTGRPLLRVQHTRNMEESHVLGQWVVRNGHTEFELGPLPYAMKHGLTYLADEYDFGMPAVLALYQPVLEGEPLVIKEADFENRIIKPHPMFRFIATGNTNGTGDDTGLYQGTVMQNAANYERFGIVEEVHYMEKTLEVGVVSAQGGIPRPEAEKLVDFARMIREGFASGKIGLPISPRALIKAARIGTRRGSLRKGLDNAYLNRLTRIDREAANEILNKMGSLS